MAVPLFAGRVYVADDLGAYHLPLRAFYAQQLQAGEAFDWLPSLFSGFYLSGEGQAGTYHPLHLALYRFLPLSVAFDLELLVSYPLMLAGSYLLLRRWLAAARRGLAGGVGLYVLGLQSAPLHPSQRGGRRGPLALAAVGPRSRPRAKKGDRSRFRGTPLFQAAGAFALVSLLLGSEILIGYPQYVWIGLMFTVPYALVCLATNSVPTPRWRQLVYLFTAAPGRRPGGRHSAHPVARCPEPFDPAIGRRRVCQLGLAPSAQSVASRGSLFVRHPRRRSEHARAGTLFRRRAAVAVRLAVGQPPHRGAIAGG